MSKLELTVWTVKVIRERTGSTKEQMANLLGITMESYQALEDRARPMLASEMLKLASFINLDPRRIIE